MTIPSVIEQITQRIGASAADWEATTQPVPNNVLLVAMDTGDVKRGNGVALYADLPVLFNVNDVVEFMTLLAGKADIGHIHVAANISDLNTILAGYALAGHTHTVASLPEVQTALADRPTTATVNAALALKADKTDVDLVPAMTFIVANSGVI